MCWDKLLADLHWILESRPTHHGDHLLGPALPRLEGPHLCFQILRALQYPLAVLSCAWLRCCAQQTAEAARSLCSPMQQDLPSPHAVAWHG